MIELKKSKIKTSPQNISETVKNDNDKDISKERYISPEERQKTTIINLLENTSNQPSKFRTKKLVEINHLCGTCSINSQIMFKTSVLKSSLCDYSDAYILMSRTITILNTGTPSAPSNVSFNIVIIIQKHQEVEMNQLTDEPPFNNNDAISDFAADKNNSF